VLADLDIDLNEAGLVGSGIFLACALFVVWRGIRVRLDVHHHRDREEPDDRGV
jgi:hypothetical protein